MSISTGYLSRRRFALAGATAGLLGVGLLTTAALQSADAADGDALFAADADADGTDESEPDVAGDPSTISHDLETYELVVTRDPFDTVRPATAESGSVEQTGATGGTTGGSEGATPVGNENGENGEGGGEAAPACTTNGEVVCDGRVVTVLSTVIGGDSAIIQVDSTVHEVEIGTTFAGSFSLLSVDGEGCARMLYGDEAFTQCPGNVTHK